MRLFSVFAKSELLCSRSSRSSRSSSRSSYVFLLSFFCSFFLGNFFLGRLCFFLYFSSRSSYVSTSSRSSRLSSISSENYGGERNSYEGGYDCGQNFFHLYYLQRDMFVLLSAGGVPKKILFISACFLRAYTKSHLLTFMSRVPHTQHGIPYMRYDDQRYATGTAAHGSGLPIILAVPLYKTGDTAFDARVRPESDRIF